MSRSARPPTQPGKTAVFTQVVVFPTSPKQTSLPCLVFHLLLKLLFHSFLKMLAHLIFTDSPLWDLLRAKWWIESGQIHTSHKFLCKLVRVFHKWGESLLAFFFFKNPHTSHHWVWILIQPHSHLGLINLYPCSTDLTPRPLLSLGRYNTAVELRGCLWPFSLINFLVSLSMLCKSPNGQCWIHIGYVKTSKANGFVALKRLASDRLLVQINESLCKYLFAATASV